MYPARRPLARVSGVSQRRGFDHPVRGHENRHTGSMRRVVALAALLAPTVAHADATVTITLNQLGMEEAARLGLSVPQLIADAEARIDELYSVSRLPTLLRNFGDAAAFQQRASSIDYDVDANDLHLGFSATGVNGDIAIGTTNEWVGSALTYSALAGVNLGRWNHPKWSIFANGFYHTTTVYSLEGGLLALGAHVQYKVVPPTQPAGARWMGVDLTTGLEYGRWTVGNIQNIESHFTARGPNDYRTVHMSSAGTLEVLSSTVTVPLEVSTGVRLGGGFVLFAGGGVSFTGGESTITASLNSLLTINADRQPIGNAIIVGEGASSPSTANVYALGGLAIHTRHVRVFLNFAKSPGELAVSIGTRAVF